MRERVTTILEVLGFVLIVAGVARVSVAAATVMAGLILVLVGFVEGTR